MMHNVSPYQAMTVWGDLVEAYYGLHGYGSTVAEVYCYRLQRHDPTADHLKGTATGKTAERLRALLSNRSLLAIVMLFCETYPDARVKVDGRKAGNWLRACEQDHRWHIEVTRKRGRWPTPKEAP